MQCIHAVCSFINTLTLLFVGIQLLNIRKTWSNNGLFGSCSTVWLHFDDPTGLASTSSYGWHCSDVDGALRKLQMLAWIGRGDVCLGSPVGVGLGCDFRTSQGASKIDSGFFFVYRKCISCQIWLFWVYIYLYLLYFFWVGLSQGATWSRNSPRWLVDCCYQLIVRRKMKQMKHDIQVDAWNSSVLTSARSDERTRRWFVTLHRGLHMWSGVVASILQSEPDRYVRTDNTCSRSAKNDMNCFGQKNIVLW